LIKCEQELNFSEKLKCNKNKTFGLKMS